MCQEPVSIWVPARAWLLQWPKVLASWCDVTHRSGSWNRRRAELLFYCALLPLGGKNFFKKWRMIQDLAKLEKERKGNGRGVLSEAQARWSSLAAQAEFSLVADGRSTCPRRSRTHRTSWEQHGARGRGAGQTRGPWRAWLRLPPNSVFISFPSMFLSLTSFPFSASFLCCFYLLTSLSISSCYSFLVAGIPFCLLVPLTRFSLKGVINVWTLEPDFWV